MSKTLEQRLAEVDERYGLSSKREIHLTGHIGPEEDEEGAVEERKRKKRKKKEEVREVTLREGVTAKYDRATGTAYVTLDEAELSLSERLDEIDERHGVRVG